MGNNARWAPRSPALPAQLADPVLTGVPPVPVGPLLGSTPSHVESQRPVVTDRRGTV
ncbi:hypothetical protein GCM10009790_23560 [Georgenia ruanii]